MFSEEVKKTTATLYCNGEFIGSGVIMLWNNSLYVVTAAHNLYGIEFELAFEPNEWEIKDYQGNGHSIKQIYGNIDFSKGNDIALFSLKTDAPFDNYITPYFSEIPLNNEPSFLFRGSYSVETGPVNKPGISYLEKYKSTTHQFLGIIDKNHLSNRSFDFGSQWLGGCSGSGLFLENRQSVICAGILLEIPDKGDNGQLLFCSANALQELGLSIRLLTTDIYKYNPENFTKEWFDQKLIKSIDALGKRYTPKLNFDLPIAKIFDGLSRNKLFQEEINRYFSKIFKKKRRCYTTFGLEFLSDLTAQINEKLSVFKGDYLKTKFTGLDKIDFEGFKRQCEVISALLAECESRIYEARKVPEIDTATSSGRTKPYSDSMHEISELSEALRIFRYFIDSKTCRLANAPYAILKGEAGYGKSHLLADIAHKGFNNDEFALLILGHHFVSAESPWYQIISKMYTFHVDEETFLGQLDAKAQLSGKRIIVIIDAINEGNGKSIWKDHLKDLIQTVKKYKGLGLIISIRTSYHKLLVDETIYTENLAESIVHHGFSELEYEAADYFFDNYKIKKPRIPFLHPEFRSPLFLKLFCDGLAAMKMTEIPEGYEGISAILNFFLAAINEKLAEKLNYNKNINLVRKAVDALAVEIIRGGLGYLSFEQAVYFFNDVPELRIISNPSVFADLLVDEGVLSKNLYRNKDGAYEDGIFFLYERFYDHLIAAHLIGDIGELPAKVFSEGGKLYDFFKDERNCNINSGLIEAMSIQIPEKYYCEFFELVPYVADTDPIARAFINSIIWRKADSFPNQDGFSKLIDYINNCAFSKYGLKDLFIENLLLITSVPGHPFNADYLHKTLFNLTMPQRDGNWLIWFAENYHWDASSVKRLIDWAWKDEVRKNISDGSIILSATTLSWFLICSDREIRNGATKAIICLFRDREKLLLALLERFEHVNDPYIYERLYGIAYGVTLRADKHDFLDDLSTYIFTRIFDQEYVYPHILLRDYAKGIIEFASNVGTPIKFDIVKTRPPYNSIRITDMPSNEEVDRLYELKKEDSPYYHYQNQILSSMTTESGRKFTGYGDFGRYTFQRALRSWKGNAQLLSNYGIKRIFELGYDINIHGKYDSEQRSGRSSGNRERIGKKYQWIVMHEILARIADHDAMFDESSFKREKQISYQGAWQIGARDIDPTSVIKKTLNDDNSLISNMNWWVKAAKLDWDLPNSEWMLTEKDIPEDTQQLLIKDKNGIEWFCLDIKVDGSDETKLGEDPYDGPTKRYYKEHRCYLVPESEFNAFKDWCHKSDYTNEHLPEPAHNTQLFSREFYWSEAYKFFQQPYYGGNGDSKFTDWHTNKLIANLHLPVQTVFWEAEEDASKSQNIFFYRPTEKIHKGLHLNYAHNEGILVDQNGEIACFDPSVNEFGASCLLVRKDLMLKYLAENKLKICWTVSGEKQILGSDRTGDISNPKTSHNFSGFFYLEGDEINGGRKSQINTWK